MYRTLQQTLRRAVPLAAVAAVALAGAPEARAQAIGFVWNNNPTTPGTTTPDAAYSYNSSGDAIGITRNVKGYYTVTFYGLGDASNGNVVLTAYGAGPDYCTAGSWYSSNDTDVQADVYCYNKDGDRADHYFTLLYQARTHSDPTTPSVAYLLANQPSSSSYTPTAQYNPSGGVNTITHSATGNYTANLPGLDRTGGTAIVSAVGSTGARCQVTNWGSGSSGTDVNVNCVDVLGGPYDEEFTLVYSIYETAGYGAGSGNGGAIWASNDTRRTPYDVSTRYSIPIDGEEMYAQRIGKGKYVWSMNVEDQWTSSTVLVTAYDAPGSYCSTDYWSSSSTETYVYVNCFAADSTPADTRFTATFQLAGCCTIR